MLGGDFLVAMDSYGVNPTRRGAGRGTSSDTIGILRLCPILLVK
jgi:hypothetical protein